jgi:hypothetical protein
MKQLGIALAISCLVSGATGCGSSSASGSGGGETTTGSHGTTSGMNGGGGGAGGGASSASGGSASAKACKDSAQARCDRLKTCSDDYLVVERYESDADCVARLDASCEASLAAPSTAQTPANVEACATLLANEACEDLLDQNPSGACLPPHGKLASGKACAFDGQCSSGWCQVDKAAVCGKCGEMPAPGAACTDPQDCGYDQDCGVTTHKCVKVVAKGGSCGDDLPCAADLSCVGATAGAGGKCVAAVVTKGAACDPTRKTMPDCERDLGLVCDATTKKCAAITLAATGMACGIVSGAFVGCASGSACVVSGDATAGTCQKFAADGAACDSDKGPICVTPAKCVASGKGTAGTCTLADATSCK